MSVKGYGNISVFKISGPGKVSVRFIYKKRYKENPVQPQ